ncbi:MAG: U32 family peptidase [Bacilli bacterium]
MKQLVMPKSIKQTKDLLEYIDGIIIGHENLTVNMPNYFCMEEIKQFNTLMKENKKSIFISLNKNIFNSDLKELKETMKELETLKIDGILFYDIALVNIKKENNYKTPLVWNQEHLTTNYLTSNFWYDFGATFTMLSSEITLDEIKEIKANTKARLILPVFGYLPMFVSRRHLVKNYLDTFNLKDNSKINYIEKEDKIYPIIDTKNGTIAYSNVPLNALEETLELDLDYILLDSFNIEDETFKIIVKLFRDVNKDNLKEYNEIINNLIETNKGFLYNETIYKVKK